MIRKVLQEAQGRGDIEIEDCAQVALQFVALLRGDLHLEILFGLRRAPDATEIHARVEGAVELILNGAGRRCLEASQSEAA